MIRSNTEIFCKKSRFFGIFSVIVSERTSIIRLFAFSRRYFTHANCYQRNLPATIKCLSRGQVETNGHVTRYFLLSINAGFANTISMRTHISCTGGGDRPLTWSCPVPAAIRHNDGTTYAIITRYACGPGCIRHTSCE